MATPTPAASFSTSWPSMVSATTRSVSFIIDAATSTRSPDCAATVHSSAVCLVSSTMRAPRAKIFAR